MRIIIMLKFTRHLSDSTTITFKPLKENNTLFAVEFRFNNELMIADSFTNKEYFIKEILESIINENANSFNRDIITQKRFLENAKKLKVLYKDIEQNDELCTSYESIIKNS